MTGGSRHGKPSRLASELSPSSSPECTDKRARVDDHSHSAQHQPMSTTPPPRALDQEGNDDPSWYTAIKRFLQRELQESYENNKKTWTEKEMVTLFNKALQVGIDVDDLEYNIHWKNRQELKKMKELIHTTNDIITKNNRPTSVSYASLIRDGQPFDCTSPPPKEPERFFFSVTLSLDGRRMSEEAFGKVKKELCSILTPSTKNIRVSLRQSAKGNAVLEFPTKKEMDEAKYLLKGNNKYNNIYDEGDRKVSMWLKNFPYNKNVNLEEVKDTMILLNDVLKDKNFDLAWIGRDDSKKRLKVTIPIRSYQALRKTKYIYLEMERFPIVLLNPLPYRCFHCLQFHRPDGNCTHLGACGNCGENHPASACTSNTSKCTACKHYPFENPDQVDMCHRVFDRSCPAWKEESAKALNSLNSRLMDYAKRHPDFS